MARSAGERLKVLRQFGLQRSLPEQFVRYVVRLAHGDLLVSVRYGRPVRTLLAERLPWTLLLVGSSLIVALLMG